MGCLGNSKTEDQRNEEKAQREANKKIEKQLQKDKQVYRATHRLLLLGKGQEKNGVPWGSLGSTLSRPSRDWAGAEVGPCLPGSSQQAPQGTVKAGRRRGLPSLA